MRYRSLLVAALAMTPFVATGCSDATAPVVPEPVVQIDLPPFSNMKMEIPTTASCPSCLYGNSMKFFAPVGVDPVVDYAVTDVSAKSPNVRIAFVRRTPDPDNVCTSLTCTVTAWRVDIYLQADQAGEADVAVSLRSDSTKKSVFRVVARVSEKG